VRVCGHSLELRLNAENPAMDFLPSPGPLEVMRMPGGPFVRVDSGYEQGATVSPYYDSLLAKVIVWDETRPRALARARRALDEVEVQGVVTTAPFLREVLDVPEVVQGRYHSTFLEGWMAEGAGSGAKTREAV
jgi:acetyl-CoA carboxylase, biotin carboxylase subunit